MKCFDPVLCYTQNGKKKFRHFSQTPKVFIDLPHLVFDCGKCLFCRKKKSLELAVRCVLHSSLYTRNCFLTLTYDEKKPGYHNNFDYTDVQKFKKRLRDHVKYHYNQKIEVFNVHEYGKNGKKHWHLIVFNYDFADKQLYTYNNGNALFTSRVLSKLWPHGFNTIGDVSEASAMYQAQYTQKDVKNRNTCNSKKSHSKHSGIGRAYFLKHYKQILSLGYVPFSGRKVPVPRYYEKLAHKHYAHFYDNSYFFDVPGRKALYRPFKIGEENKEIADLYTSYKKLKEEKILELTEQWNLVISQYVTTHDQPDFIKSAQNALYDLNNRMTQERF